MGTFFLQFVTKSFKMAALRLINNLSLESEKNLCFVNTALQLLYCLPDVQHFFINQEYKINQDENADLLICDEMSRIFKSAGQYGESAAFLRLLVGQRSGNLEICSGRQQDVTDFLRLLFQQIEIEIAELDGPQTLFINKFWGREHVVKKFANSSDGKCSSCGNLPRQESEDFNIMKLAVINTNTILSLSSMIENCFSEGTDVFKMKCSECCPHLTKCPLTGNCKLKNAIDQKLLFRTPEFLFIQLLRFEQFNNYKTTTIVVPEEILTLPNGEKYKFTGSADHLGDLIKNGHYEANAKSGEDWIRCNDEDLSRAYQVVTSNNYVFLYSKIKPDIISVPKVQREEDKASIVCRNCKKVVVDLAKHHAESLICKQTIGFKTCKVDLPRISLSKKNSKESLDKFCSNCKTKVNSLEQHFSISFICKQVHYNSSTERGKASHGKLKTISKPSMKSKLSLKKEKCTFCLK